MCVKYGQHVFCISLYVLKLEARFALGTAKEICEGHINRYIAGTEFECVGSIQLAHEGAQCRLFVYTVMKHRSHMNKKFLCQLINSQLCKRELV